MDVGADCQVVLLGSIASGKYLDLMSGVLGERLWVPREFIGMGDMSRGALLLRCVAEQRELSYIPAAALAGGRPDAPPLHDALATPATAVAKGSSDRKVRPG